MRLATRPTDNSIQHPKISLSGFAAHNRIMSDGTRPVVEQPTRLDTARVRAARRVIDPIFLDTPLYRCAALQPDLGCTVSIKLETANPVRSFKARGAEVLASMLADNGSRAVVCARCGQPWPSPRLVRSQPGTRRHRRGIPLCACSQA